MSIHIIKNIFFVAIQQFVNVILPLLTVPYISRKLGVEINGIYSYTLTIVTIFTSFFSFGFITYGVRVIAQSESTEERNKSFYEIQKLRTLCLIIGGVIYLIYSIFFSQYTTILLYQGLLIFILIFDISWYYQGVGNFKIVVQRNIIIKIFGVLLTFILVKSEKDLIVYILLINGSQLIGNLILYVQCLKETRLHSSTTINFIYHFGQSFTLFLPSLSVMVYSNIDKIILGASNNMIELGNYQQSIRLLSIINTILITPSGVILSHVSSLLANNKKNQAIVLIKRGLNIYLKGVVLLIGFIIIIGVDFTCWFLGPEYSYAGKLLIVISPLLLFKSLGSIFGSWYLIPFGKNKSYAYPLVLGSIINIIMNIFLIPKIGVLGAAISNVATECVITCFQLIFVKEIFNIEQYKKFIFSLLNTFCIVMIVSFIFKYFYINNILLLIVIKSFTYSLFTMIYLLLSENKKMLLYLDKKIGGIKAFELLK